MIEKYHKNLTDQSRVGFLNRALHSLPFFTALDFDLPDLAVVNSLYKAKAEINKDFYLTDIRSNCANNITLDPVTHEPRGFLLLSLYSNLLEKSVYGSNLSILLPSSNISCDVREAGISFLSDLQRDELPYLIKAGERVIAQIQPYNPADIVASQISVVLGGFSINQYYINRVNTDLINESLNNPVKWQLFKKTVNNDLPSIDINFENDRSPRLILGFGIRLKDTFSTFNPKLIVQDITRELKFNQIPFYSGFVAPKVGASGAGTLARSEDIHFYYLPIEYYFEPFARMQLSLTDIAKDFGDMEFDIVMLTRTV
jgi:hypothetical protein